MTWPVRGCTLYTRPFFHVAAEHMFHLSSRWQWCYRAHVPFELAVLQMQNKKHAWIKGWRKEWMYEWMNAMNEFMNGMKEWINEWMNECITEIQWNAMKWNQWMNECLNAMKWMNWSNVMICFEGLHEWMHACAPPHSPDSSTPPIEYMWCVVVFVVWRVGSGRALGLYGS